jgi:hypothetical protein
VRCAAFANSALTDVAIDALPQAGGVMIRRQRGQQISYRHGYAVRLKARGESVLHTAFRHCIPSSSILQQASGVIGGQPAPSEWIRRSSFLAEQSSLVLISGYQQ